MSKFVTRTFFRTTGKYPTFKFNENNEPIGVEDAEFEIVDTVKPTKRDIQKATNNSKFIHDVKTVEVLAKVTFEKFMANAEITIKGE